MYSVYLFIMVDVSSYFFNNSVSLLVIRLPPCVLLTLLVYLLFTVFDMEIVGAW